ncbi:MAG: hypothetical protein ABSH03_20325 [Candidatus Lustribacter sp.]|jgi:hypothetical protein
MTDTVSAPTGAALIAALLEAKVEFVTAVPDIWTSAGFLWPLSKEPALRYPHAYTYSELAAFTDDLPRLMQLDGPVCATLKLVPGQTPLNIDYRWMHGPQTRAGLKRAIQSLILQMPNP